MQYYKKGIEMFREKTGYAYTFHDALLTAYLVDPSVAELVQSDYTVELAGRHTRGSMVLNTKAYDFHTDTGKDFYYAASMDVEKFRQLVRERIN